jgi:hypothetical protein
MRFGRGPGIFLAVAAVSFSLISAQQAPDSSGKSKEVCVAGVANSSGGPVFVEQVKERLVQELRNRRVNAVSVSTMTVLANSLELSFMNRKAFRANKCDYMLLTEIAALRADSAVPQSAPKTQPADSASAKQNHAAVDFALFRKQHSAAVLSGSLSAEEASSLTAAASAAAGPLADQVFAAVSKK